MPRILFEGVTGRPVLDLIVGDYFYAAQDPNIPLPDSPSDVIDRVKRVVGPIDELVKDAAKIPTQFDINGCDVGDVMARNANNLNKINQGNFTLNYICEVLMDDPADGFMTVYNRFVRMHARVLFFDAPQIFPNVESERNAFIQEQHNSLRGQVMGSVRAYHAALQCAYVRFLSADHLEAGSRAPIVRKGMNPEDFKTIF